MVAVWAGRMQLAVLQQDQRRQAAWSAPPLPQLQLLEAARAYPLALQAPSTPAAAAPRRCGLQWQRCPLARLQLRMRQPPTALWQRPCRQQQLWRAVQQQPRVPLGVLMPWDWQAMRASHHQWWDRPLQLVLWQQWRAARRRCRSTQQPHPLLVLVQDHQQWQLQGLPSSRAHPVLRRTP